MSPYRHGEIFVTEDGGETDIDIGHYERFLGKHFTAENNISAGKIYQNIIAKERRGEFNGRDVQVIPHITNAIQDVMMGVAKDNDIVIVELGGTIGDIESMAHVEAIRQFRKKLGQGGSIVMHLTLIPYLESSGEIKTKPTQNSVRDLSRLGVNADIIVCRTASHIELDTETREKLVMYCNLDNVSDVIQAKDAKSIYEVPLLMKEQNLDDIVLKKLGLKAPKGNLADWEKMVAGMTNGGTPKTIAIVGKYIEVPDAYLSVMEAIKSACLVAHVKPKIKLIHAEDIEKNGAEKMLNDADAIIVPGGFGSRGLEGKIATAAYARKHNIPFLGIGLGMRTAIIQFARMECGIKDHKPMFVRRDPMQRGSWKVDLVARTNTQALYGKTQTEERHRHRYELTEESRAQLESKGLIVSGTNGSLAEIIELPNHPFFVATLFHPELISKPYEPHPLFVGLVKSLIV